MPTTDPAWAAWVITATCVATALGIIWRAITDRKLEHEIHELRTMWDDHEQELEQLADRLGDNNNG